MAKGDSNVKGYTTCWECKHADHDPDRACAVWCRLRNCSMFSRWTCGDAERREDDQESEECTEDEK